MFPNTVYLMLGSTSFPTLKFGPDSGVGVCLMRVGLGVKASFQLFLGVYVGEGFKGKGGISTED